MFNQQRRKALGGCAEDQLHQATTVKSRAVLLFRNHLSARLSVVTLRS